MTDDPFGDLRNWGAVLNRLEQLSDQKGLDAVQPGLVRLIRYRSNWQLRERALLCAREVANPSCDLLSAVLDLAVHRGVYLDARILAVNALAVLFAKQAAAHSPLRRRVIDELGRQLLEPEAPVFRLAVGRALEKIRKTSREPVAGIPVGAHATAD